MTMKRAAWVAAASCTLGACSLAFPIDRLGAGEAEPALADSGEAAADAPAEAARCAWTWEPLNTSATGAAFDLVLRDVDLDGRLDLALAANWIDTNSPSRSAGGPKIMLGRKGGVFESWSSFSTQTLAAMDVAVAKLDGDGRPDVVVALDGSGEGVGAVDWALVTNTGALGPPGRIYVPHPRAVEVGDVDGDGVPDIVALARFATSGTADERVVVFRGSGSATFESGIEYGASAMAGENTGASLVVGDFTGDGIDDVAVSHWGTHKVTLLAGQRRDRLKRVTSVTVCSGNWGIAKGDFDGDHVLDLVVACSYENGFMILTGTGGGFFRAGAPIALVSDPASVLGADLDRDGRDDVILVGRGQVGYRLSRGNGAFGEAFVESRGAIERQAGAAVGDIDGDGVNDVIVAPWSAEYPVAMRGACR